MVLSEGPGLSVVECHYLKPQTVNLQNTCLANRKETRREWILVILGWPKSPLGFFHNILWENPNKLFGQPHI